MKPFSPGNLSAACLMDTVLGDPEGMPHPVRWMGVLIAAGERCWMPGRSKGGDIVSGTALTAAVITASVVLGRLSKVWRPFEIVFAWTTLAAGSLIRETMSVENALARSDVQASRIRLSRLVGRDTEFLDESEIARAVLETLSESLCDGVVAPLLYLTVGGVPLALAYKAVNTCDSMIGHMEHPYTYFGRLAARLDDGANYLPARMTALLIVVAAFLCRLHAGQAFLTWTSDGNRHASPNAGQSEAAMAGALRVRLGGTNYYSGIPSRKPRLGAGFRAPAAHDIRPGIRLARTASLLAFTLAFAYTWKSHRRC